MNPSAFPLVKGIYNSNSVPHFDFVELSSDLIRSRGNEYKLVQHHCHYNLKKYNFTNSVIPIQNSLSTLIILFLRELLIILTAKWISFGRIKT